MAEDFKPQTIPFGRGSLDLRRPIGEIAAENYAALFNAYRRQDGLLTGRPGLTQLLTGINNGAVNSICRLNLSLTPQPFAADGLPPIDSLGLHPVGVRFIGTSNLGGNLFYAAVPAAVLIDSGYSGNSLCFLPYRPPLAATPWVYIADSNKMSKATPISTTKALVLPLGLPAPSNPDARMPMDEFPPELYFGGWDGSMDLRQIANFTLFGFEAVEGAAPQLVTLQAQDKTVIDACESAAPWTGSAGTGGAPTITTDAVDFKEGLASLKITTAVGGATTEYYNFLSRALSLDLTRVGTKPATDEDHLHGWVQFDQPKLIQEIRFYYILSNYSATALPGDDATSNKNFYAKAIRADDFTSFLSATGNALESQTTQNTNTSVQQVGGGLASVAGVPTVSGAKNWTEFGALKFPLRRGDFKRFGDNEALDWSDVVGLTILIFTTTNSAVNVWFDDLSFVGGAGPDSSIAGDVPYDYRYRNYDPRTGVKGNPCPVSLENFWIDPVRQAVIVKPVAFGDPEIRQQVFRRGGVLTRAWYFVGQNAQDGGSIEDRLTDASIINAEILQEDNDQPVTTVDANNRIVLAQPLHTIFGPVDDTIFGLGDPYRKGDIYWCKKGDADAWPAYQHIELCGTAEELVGGYVYANQPYAFSREQGFVLFPNLGGSGQVGYAPTGCKRGPVSRTAYAVGIKGCYFVARDGFYGTAGGPEECLSFDWVDPIFKLGLTEPNTQINGLYPIDFGFTILVACHGHDVWISYFDTQGTQRALIYDVLQQYWRAYKFPVNYGPSGLYSEPAQPLSLLVGGEPNVWSHTGTADGSLPIAGTYKSGSLDQDVDRADKLYGDIWIQKDSPAASLSITPRLNDETITLPTLTLLPNVGGMSVTTLDPFDSVGEFGNPGPREAQSLSLEVSWSTVEAPPLLRQWGLSFLVTPESTIGRPTDWDAQGRLTDKQVKGILLECDTGGVNKTLVIEADGGVKVTLTVNHNGRLSKHYAWPEFLGRMLRFNPVDTVEWKIYDYRWIFDEEPAQLDRWETQLLDHGIPGWKSVQHGYVTYKTEAGSKLDVTMEVDVYDNSGNILQTLVPTPLLTFTNGTKIKRFIGFTAHKGEFFKYRFTSDTKFWLYREETSILCQPWDGGDAKLIQGFGDDDLDLVRGLHDAGAMAARPGGGA